MIPGLLKRLGNIGRWIGGEVLNSVYDGLAEELERVRIAKNLLLSGVVPNENMDVSLIPDYMEKYGIWSFSGTDEQKIQMIMERASLSGACGPGWIQQQIRTAGYDLYVHENLGQFEEPVRYGVHRYGTVRYSHGGSPIDPATVPGVLYVNSPPRGDGALLVRYGPYRYGTVRYGARVPDTAYPQPYIYDESLVDSDYWKCFIFISPFADKLANSNELQELEKERYEYLGRLIIALKSANIWAIAQVKEI